MRLVPWKAKYHSKSSNEGSYAYDVSVIFILFQSFQLTTVIRTILWLFSGKTQLDFSISAKMYLVFGGIALIEFLLTSAVIDARTYRYNRFVVAGLLMAIMALALLSFGLDLWYCILAMARAIHTGQHVSAIAALVETCLWLLVYGAPIVGAPVLAYRVVTRRPAPYMWSAPYSTRHCVSMGALSALLALTMAQLSFDPGFTVIPDVIALAVSFAGIVLAVATPVGLGLVPNLGVGRLIPTCLQLTRTELLLVAGTIAMLCTFFVRWLADALGLPKLGIVVVFIQAIANITVTGVAFAMGATQFPSQLQPVVLTVLAAGTTAIQPLANTTYWSVFAVAPFHVPVYSSVLVLTITRAGVIALMPGALVVVLLLLNDSVDAEAAAQFDEGCSILELNRQEVNSYLVENSVLVPESETRHKQVTVLVTAFIALFTSALAFSAFRLIINHWAGLWWGAVVECSPGDTACRQSNLASAHRYIIFGETVDELIVAASIVVLMYLPFVMMRLGQAGIGAVSLAISMVPPVGIVIATLLHRAGSGYMKRTSLSTAEASNYVFETIMLIGAASVIRDLNKDSLAPSIFALAVVHAGLIGGEFLFDFAVTTGRTSVIFIMVVGLGVFRAIGASLMLLHPFFYIGRCGYGSASFRVRRLVPTLGLRTARRLLQRPAHNDEFDLL
ncbi:hypothetical protein J8273_8346 [Carpediemonas membranifera]|uniref:Uncharacterized protein n=1 Tax=Carpediemonas membranifera TaxID=201153 RepID=A0A8J6BUF7_9EUKA|nr:hypothetical protein J8273_8346 [Carpediemonas membranifera]|eukprot:KAG9390306.1 hypothetical protein J8273_8346 [Carpediemonas membranifera]